jgi:uncharacterized protein with PIN domain
MHSGRNRITLGQHPPITRTAFFRFYEELNDFLPEAQRKITFPYTFRGTPTIKHTIEAVGVPHTEIDVILVNGESVGFEHRLQGGERVAVYPVFESFDITPLVRLRPKPLREPRFVVDVHLGKLARKLRLLGFDTVFNNDLTDHDIVERAVQEHRIILTRDKGIFKHKAVTHGYWVRHADPDAQVREVVKRLQLEHNFQPFTRCSECNERLHPVDNALLHNRVPGETLRVFDAFMECKRCKRVYWQGSHYDRICAWIEILNSNVKREM